MSAFQWAAVTACIWGIVPILEKLGLQKIEPLVGLFYRCLGILCGFVFLAFFMLRPSQIKSADVRSAAFLIAGGFLASFLGQICFYRSLKIGEISKVLPLSASYPLITFILGVAVLGESMNITKVTGAVLITIGIWVLKAG